MTWLIGTRETEAALGSSVKTVAENCGAVETATSLSTASGHLPAERCLRAELLKHSAEARPCHMSSQKSAAASLARALPAGDSGRSWSLLMRAPPDYAIGNNFVFAGRKWWRRPRSCGPHYV